MVEGFQHTEVGIIPSDWNVSTLGACLKQDPDYGINAPATQFNELLPAYLRITDISEDGDYLKKNIVSVNASNSTNYFLEKGDLVFARTGASVGKTYLYNPLDGKLVFAGFLIRVKSDEKKLNPFYLKYLTQMKYYWDWIRTNSMRTGQPGINGNEYKELPIPLPPTLKEQLLIAEALNDANTQIQSLEQFIVKKRDIRKGAMQELLRPKEDWVEKKLGNCLLQNPDYGINASAVEFSETLPVYIRITDITEDGRFSKKNIVSVDMTNSSNYYLKEGDLVFARTGASVGKTYLYNPKDGMLVFAGFLIRVKVDPSKLLPNYLKYYTQTEVYKHWIQNNSMRTGQPGINGNEYQELVLSLPPTIQEQKAITEALNDFDEEIYKLEENLEKLKMIKQGMMQNLLTGKIRLV
jgi:type I restriction enzyme, S subunit